LHKRQVAGVFATHLRQLELVQLTQTLVLRTEPRGHVVQLDVDEQDVEGLQLPLVSEYPPKQVRQWLVELHVAQGKGHATAQLLPES